MAAMRWAIAISILLLVFSGAKRVAANHSIYLPYAGQTWLEKIVISQQEYTYCLDSRAAAYPSFESQLADVVTEYAKRTGIKAREVPFGDPSCEVEHLMLPAFPCGAGAAACVNYANDPVTIHYQETLGYADWRSAQGHELGHAVLGNLNERYIDSGGSIQCGGPESGYTVMDCGYPYIRYPQSIDVQRGCAIIQTSWCGTDATALPPQDCATQGWDACTGRWYAPDGWSYNPADGSWWNPDGQREWSACDFSWRGRYNYLGDFWVSEGTPVFRGGGWRIAPAC